MKNASATLLLAGLALAAPLSPGLAEVVDFNDPNREYTAEINARVLPVFPHALIQRGFNEGKVVLMAEVDHFGELRDYIITYASHPDFAKSIERVISTWDFKPPTLNGNPASVVRKVEVNFQASGQVISFDLSSGLLDRALPYSARVTADQYQIAEIDALDRFPEALEVIPPSVSKEAMRTSKDRVATFSFYIDTAGRPRLVCLQNVDGAIDTDALLAAQDALTQWKFSVPTVKGRPVVVYIAQPFRFIGDIAANN